MNYELSVIIYQLGIISYQLSIINCQSSSMNYELSIMNYELSIIQLRVAQTRHRVVSLTFFVIFSPSWDSHGFQHTFVFILDSCFMHFVSVWLRVGSIFFLFWLHFYLVWVNSC